MVCAARWMGFDPVYTEDNSLCFLIYTDCIIIDGADASRLAIKRLQRTAVPASKLACPSAADPQHVRHWKQI